MATITGVKARQIFDSRGNPTVEVRFFSLFRSLFNFIFRSLFIRGRSVCLMSIRCWISVNLYLIVFSFLVNLNWSMSRTWMRFGSCERWWSVFWSRRIGTCDLCLLFYFGSWVVDHGADFVYMVFATDLSISIWFLRFRLFANDFSDNGLGWYPHIQWCQSYSSCSKWSFHWYVAIYLWPNFLFWYTNIVWLTLCLWTFAVDRNLRGSWA